MSTLLIPYKSLEGQERLPFITLTLNGPKRSVRADAFADSGADFSIFDASIMEYIGFKKRKAEVRRVQVGDGDWMKVFLFQVGVNFYGYSFVAPITFASQLGVGLNLLGRRGFFNRFRFCFDDKNFRLSIHLSRAAREVPFRAG